LKKMFFVMFVCLNFPIFSQEIMRLDNAIQFVGNQIINDLRQGSSVAILNFDSPSTRFSNYTIEVLTNQFVNSRKFTVVEKQRLDIVRQEEQDQLSGNVSDNTAVRIGHNIGAQYIILGSLIDLGTTYRFGIYVINMQRAVREASSYVYLSGYDEQVVFLVTGSNIRPSEKRISPNLTMASAKAGFMQSISTMIGNSFTNKIPRNSKIAILIPGNYVAGDYVRNEIYYILNASNRFQLIPFNDIDTALSQFQSSRSSIAVYSREELQEIGRRLGATILIHGSIMEYELHDSSNILIKANSEIILQLLYVNTLQEIGMAYAAWKWPENEEQYFER